MEKNNYKENCNTMTFEFYGFEHIKGVGILNLNEEYLMFSNSIDLLLTKDNETYCCTTNYTLPIQIAEQTPGYVMFKLTWFKMFIETMFLENQIFLKDQIVWDVKTLFSMSFANLSNYMSTMAMVDSRLIYTPYYIKLPEEKFGPDEYMYSEVITHFDQLATVLTAKIDLDYVKTNYSMEYTELEIEKYLTVSEINHSTVLNNLNNLVLSLKNKLNEFKLSKELTSDIEVFPIYWDDNVIKLVNERILTNKDAVNFELHLAFTIEK